MEYLLTLRGILNREWAVQPPGSNNDAIPDEATAKIIFPSDLSLLIIACHKKVFHVRPWLWTKKISGFCSSTTLITASYTFFLSVLSCVIKIECSIFNALLS